MTTTLHSMGRSLVRPLLRRSHLLLGHEQGERGVIAVLAALVLTVTITSAALSLDVAGRVTEVRRDQATADLAALDAVRNLPFAQTVAAGSARRNGVDNTKTGIGVTATLGEISEVNGTNVFSPGRSLTAVQVTVSTPYKDFLGGGKGSMVATASASNVGLAGFSVGSTLVSINTGLGKFAGANLGLIGYNGLASGTVTLGALATKLGLSALTPDQVLAYQVTAAQVVNAGAGLLGAASPSYASLMALGTTLAGSARNGANPVKIGDMLGLIPGSGVGLDASVNLLEAFTGAVQLANGKAGLSVNFGLTVPGVASASFALTAIVPPTIVYGPLGVSATNTQVTVNLLVDINIGGLGFLGLSLAVVHLPITLTLGGATGTLKAIDCANATPLDIKLGTAFPTLSTTVPANAGIVSVLGISLGNFGGPITIVSNGVADAVLNYPANFTQNLVANLPVNVISSFAGTAIAGMTGTGLGGILSAAALNLVLGTVMPLLVNSVVTGLISNLGITVGNADFIGIRPSDPQCAVPRLAK